MLVPLNITGGSYKHKSLPLSAQLCRNFLPQKQPLQSEKSAYVLESWFGKTLFGTQSGGSDRGMFEHQGILYKVTGTTLYTVSSGGVHTSRGTISGSGRCIFAGFGSNILISAENVRYQWNGSALSTISDGDLEAGDSVATLNNQALYDGTGGRFCSSDVGTATSINALNYATAESNADNLIRVFVAKQVALMFGEKTIEPWWNSGVGNPPFDRVEGGIIEVGLGALYSVDKNDSFVYFLGDDFQVYALAGSDLAIVSSPALAREFANYDTKDDAIGWCMTLNGQNYYVLTFPTENKTFVYQEAGEWFEWSYGSGGNRSLANSYAFCFGKHLVADYSNGNIYQLDENTYTDNSEPIIRTRDTAPLHGGMIGKPGKTLEMNRFELILETGVGLISGQGSNPMVMLSFSDDGGKTFSTEMWATAGAMGQYQWKVEWFCLGSFESRILRVRVSDPIYWSIHSAAADIEVGI